MRHTTYKILQVIPAPPGLQMKWNDGEREWNEPAEFYGLVQEQTVEKGEVIEVFDPVVTPLTLDETTGEYDPAFNDGSYCGVGRAS